MSSCIVKLAGFGSVWLLGSSALVSHKLSHANATSIVLGTYEGFIYPGMVDYISNEYGIRVDYFDHDQVVKSKFKNGSYSLATVSTSILEELIDSNLLETVNWNKLDLKLNNDKVTKTSDENKSIFSDIVDEIAKSNTNLLKYGIPYFTNKLSFCYVGDEITDLKPNSSDLTWDVMISKISNQNLFKSQDGKPSIGMIDDPRSILSLSRFVRGNNNVNKNNSQSYEQIYDDYRQLINKGLNKSMMRNNFLMFDSNSVNLVDALVEGDIKGAFMYNSDCLYASYGGSSGKIPNKLHSVKLPEKSDIYFLDFLVIAKNLDENQKQNVYQFVKNVLLHDHNQEPSNILDTDNTSNPKQYKYWLARNFDYVKYTPVIKNLESGVESKYFSDSGSHKTLREEILKIKRNKSSCALPIENHYERKLSGKEKSDMLIAFERFKNDL